MPSWGTSSSQRWSGKVATVPRWSGYERRAPALGRVALPLQEPDAVRLLPHHDRLRPGVDRDHRVLHVQDRPEARHALLRLARFGRLRHLVGDPVRFRRRACLAALARDAGSCGLDADASAAHRPAPDPLHVEHRALFARLDADLGTRRLRNSVPDRAPARVRCSGACDHPRARTARRRPRVHLHPLPARERALEHARVARAARDGPARPAFAPAWLVASDRMGPRPDVGCARNPRSRPGRESVALDRGDSRPRTRLPRDRRRLSSLRGAGGAQAGDALADVIAFLRIFFIGGLIAYRGLFNWIRPAIYIPTMLVGPLFQILFFAYLGRYSRLQNDAFFVV